MKKEECNTHTHTHTHTHAHAHTHTHRERDKERERESERDTHIHTHTHTHTHTHMSHTPGPWTRGTHTSANILSYKYHFKTVMAVPVLHPGFLLCLLRGLLVGNQCPSNCRRPGVPGGRAKRPGDVPACRKTSKKLISRRSRGSG